MNASGNYNYVEFQSFRKKSKISVLKLKASDTITNIALF